MCLLFRCCTLRRRRKVLRLRLYYLDPREALDSGEPLVNLVWENLTWATPWHNWLLLRLEG